MYLRGSFRAYQSTVLELTDVSYLRGDPRTYSQERLGD